MTVSGNPRAVAILGLLAGPVGATALWFLNAAGVLHLRAGPAPWHFLLLALVVAPVLEEMAFRGALQDLCGSLIRRFRGPEPAPVSWSNVITSLAFAACHTPYLTAGMSSAILLPSLLLGRLRETTGALMPCILMHAWFNACFLALVAH